LHSRRHRGGIVRVVSTRRLICLLTLSLIVLLALSCRETTEETPLSSDTGNPTPPNSTAPPTSLPQLTQTPGTPQRGDTIAVRTYVDAPTSVNSCVELATYMVPRGTIVQPTAVGQCTFQHPFEPEWIIMGPPDQAGVRELEFVQIVLFLDGDPRGRIAEPTPGASLPQQKCLDLLRAGLLLPAGTTPRPKASDVAWRTLCALKPQPRDAEGVPAGEALSPAPPDPEVRALPAPAFTAPVDGVPCWTLVTYFLASGHEPVTVRCTLY